MKLTAKTGYMQDASPTTLMPVSYVSPVNLQYSPTQNDNPPSISLLPIQIHLPTGPPQSLRPLKLCCQISARLKSNAKMQGNCKKCLPLNPLAIPYAAPRFMIHAKTNKLSHCCCYPNASPNSYRPSITAFTPWTPSCLLPYFSNAEDARLIYVP